MDSNAPVTVLIVAGSHNPDTALIATLQSHGYEVIQANNSRQAVDILNHSLPDVVVCDASIQAIDGCALLQQARTEAAWRLLPFIFLTCESGARQREFGDTGLEEYLVKPVTPHELVAAVRDTLARRRLISVEIEQNMDYLRNRIVGLLQHEFRTPLTFILGYAELLAGNDNRPLDMEELRLAAGAILTGGRQLQQLIESFLLLAELKNQTLSNDAIEPIIAWTLWNDLLRDLVESDRLGILPVRLIDQEGDAVVQVDLRLIDVALRHLYDYVQRTCTPDATLIECSVVRQFPYVGLVIRCDSVQPPPVPPVEHLRSGRRALTIPREQDSDVRLTLVHSVARIHSGRLTVEMCNKPEARFTLWLPESSKQDLRGRV